MKFKDNKKLPMIFIILGFVLTFFGSTFAYLGWRSSESQKTEIAVTIDRDFMCSIDGGGVIEDSEYQLIPTDCTNPDYAIKREVKLTSTIYKENYGILFDMWIDVKKLTSGLSNSENFKYALTTSSNSCTEGVISSGTFKGLTDNGKTEIMLSNTYESTTEDTYYLYIWLDKAQTSSETMNQQFSLSLNGSCTNDEDRIYGGKEYTVMFDSNGGNSITDTIVVTNGSVYGTLPTPTKSGSAFVGWNTEADGTGDTITSGAIVKIKKDTTLYAMWGTIDDATCPTITDYNGAYDGGKHSIAVTGGSGETIKYSSDNINWSTTIPTITNVGTLTTYVMVEGDEEHTSVMCGSKTVNISTKKIIPIISASDKIYDGNANATCTIDFDGVVSGDTVIGTLGNCEFDNANAGTGKTVTGSSITILGTNVENYSLSNTSATTTANINKSNNSVNVIASQSWSPSFSTSSQTKDITAATDGQGTVSYAIQSQKSGSTDVSYFTLSDTSITMAENTPTGSYMVVIRATAAGNDNYNSGYNDITLTVTVGKAENPISVTAKGGTYSGTALPLVTTSNVYGNVYYSTSTSLTSSNYSSSGSTTIPTGSCDNTSGNTYTVYWYTPGNTNYNSKSGTVESIKVTCQTYTISYDANGGNGILVSQTKYYGITLTLSDVVPTRSGYTFLGWSTSSAATSATWTAGGSYSVNPSGNVILYAVWKAKVFEITFNSNGGALEAALFTTVGETEYNVPSDGIYKLEVWGAQGGNANSIIGGYGGYSVGTVILTQNSKLYVNVGGKGTDGTSKTSQVYSGGYNGGGNGYGYGNKYVGGGGGATHIAKVSGVLSSLSSSQSDLLIVAGGGGGAGYQTSSYYGAGGAGGGISGVTGMYASNATSATGGTQTAAGVGQSTGSFGQGGSATGDGTGGGGGYYGGGGGQWYKGGGGGSGYIGNASLASKGMYCYNCTESTATNTKTTSTTNVSAIPTSNYAKSGAGVARITKIYETKTFTNGLKYGNLPNPTKTDSEFIGWNTKADGTGTTITSDSTVILTEDITLYAIWKSLNTIPEFTYTGNYQIVDDNDNIITTTTGNWKIRFLESGTLTFTSLNGAENGIDVFLVGGGGGGSASGGGGGYTKTEKNITVDTSTSYSITIGAGGAQSVSGAGYDGSSSSAFGVTAAGGKVGKSGVYGGDGGSGGGGYTAGNGGSDGGNGVSGGYAGGTGQGTTTREFGESSGKLYAGGGGGGNGKDGDGSVGSGGAGGGGKGVIGNNRGYAGAANTGGGGGGGIYGDNGCGGAGGSGIVIIRNAR